MDEFKKWVRVIGPSGNFDNAKSFIDRSVIMPNLSKPCSVSLMFDFGAIRKFDDGGIVFVVDGSLAGSGIVHELDNTDVAFWQKSIAVKQNSETQSFYTDPKENHVEFVFVAYDGCVSIWNICLVVQAEKKGGCHKLYSVAELVFSGQICFSSDDESFVLNSLSPFDMAEESKFWAHRNALKEELVAIYRDAINNPQNANFSLPEKLSVVCIKSGLPMSYDPEKLYAKVIWVAPHFNLFGLLILNGEYKDCEAVAPFFQIQSDPCSYRGLSVGKLVMVNGHGTFPPIVEKEDGKLCANGVRVVNGR